MDEHTADSRQHSHFLLFDVVCVACLHPSLARWSARRESSHFSERSWIWQGWEALLEPRPSSEQRGLRMKNLISPAGPPESHLQLDFRRLRCASWGRRYVCGVRSSSWVVSLHATPDRGQAVVLHILDSLLFILTLWFCSGNPKNRGKEKSTWSQSGGNWSDTLFQNQSHSRKGGVWEGSYITV